MPKRELGEILLEADLINPAQLAEALGLQRTFGERLASVLVRQHILTEKFAVTYLGRQLGVPPIDLSKTEIDLSLLDVVPLDMCERSLVFPVRVEGTRLQLAMSDPMDHALVSEIIVLSRGELIGELSPPLGERQAWRGRWAYRSSHAAAFGIRVHVEVTRDLVGNIGRKIRQHAASDQRASIFPKGFEFDRVHVGYGVRHDHHRAVIGPRDHVGAAGVDQQPTIEAAHAAAHGDGGTLDREVHHGVEFLVAWPGDLDADELAIWRSAQ